MYTYKQIEDQLTEEQQGYRLCYVDESRGKEYNEETYKWTPFDDIEERDHYDAYFTSIPMEKQWGDDWDDSPYEYNAEPPYDNHWDDNDVRTEHEILVISFSLSKGIASLPKGNCLNSPFSVCQINSGRAAWLYFENSYKCCDGKSIHAGTTAKDFIDIINTRK